MAFQPDPRAGTWWRAYSADETAATVRAAFEARYGRPPETVERLACGIWLAGPLTAEEEESDHEGA